MGHTAPGQGVADGQVHQGGDLDRDTDHLVVLGHVDEQLLERHLLLVAGAQHLGLLHAGDGQHRRMVELGVVEPVEQVDGAGARGGQADAEAPGRLGVPGGHEGGGLLVVHEDEADPVLLRRRPSMIPLMPSPGRPKMVSTPQSISRSMSASDAIFDMAASRSSGDAGWIEGLPMVGSAQS